MSTSDSRSGKAGLTLAQVNASARDGFVSSFGGVFEHSPWIAERAWDARPFSSIEALFEAMANVLNAAGATARLELIRSHPELAGKQSRAPALTRHSDEEQAGAGLNALTTKESARLRLLNQRYSKKFGFPCIIAVKGLGKTDILEIFETRLDGTPDGELSENLKQILRIARFRLAELISAD